MQILLLRLTYKWKVLTRMARWIIAASKTRKGQRIRGIILRNTHFPCTRNCIRLPPRSGERQGANWNKYTFTEPSKSNRHGDWVRNEMCEYFLVYKGQANKYKCKSWSHSSRRRNDCFDFFLLAPVAPSIEAVGVDADDDTASWFARCPISSQFFSLSSHPMQIISINLTWQRVIL